MIHNGNNRRCLVFFIFNFKEESEFLDNKSMHFVYILISERSSKHWYVGVTNNIQRRLLEHNAGDSFHTNKFKPWKLKNLIGFLEREKAEEFEKYLKTQSGRAFSKIHL